MKCNCGKPKPRRPRNLATVFGPYRADTIA